MPIPIAAIDRVARKAGVDRISAGALKELQRALEDIGFQIVREATTAALHAKRKTIKASDIKLVARKS
ncbi:MAG: histone family protein [Candidatus Aenigmarchaeota archaeon]|nr:histone family protein [Candidatus Aenigmarchaeota archaeon]